MGTYHRGNLDQIQTFAAFCRKKSCWRCPKVVMRQIFVCKGLIWHLPQLAKRSSAGRIEPGVIAPALRADDATGRPEI